MSGLSTIKDRPGRIFAYFLVMVLPFFAYGSPTGEIPRCQADLNPGAFSAEVLREKGLDPQKLSFKFFAHSAEHYEFRARYEGEVVGVFEMWQSEVSSRRTFISAQVTVSDGFEGRGLGSLMYLCGGRWLKDNLGANLRSDFSPSDQAVAVWRRFVSQGLAREENGEFVMLDSKIEGASREIYPFFIERIENPEVFEKLR